MRANPQVQNKRPAERAGVDLEAAPESVIAVRIERVAPGRRKAVILYNSAGGG